MFYYKIYIKFYKNLTKIKIKNAFKKIYNKLVKRKF